MMTLAPLASIWLAAFFRYLGNVRTVSATPLRNVSNLIQASSPNTRHLLVHGAARLFSVSEAGGAAVVGGQGATIVVAELDDDPVTRLRKVGDSVEAALTRVRTSATSADGSVVDNGPGRLERVLEERAPALSLAAGANGGHGAVTAEEDGGHTRLTLLEGSNVFSGQRRGQAEAGRGGEEKVGPHVGQSGD